MPIGMLMWITTMITPIACKIYHTQYPYQRIHVQPKKYTLIDMNTYDKYI